MILLAIHLYAMLATQTHKAPIHRASVRGESASVRRFAQQFYDWYTPKVLHENVDAEHLALTRRADAFSPELRRALMDDWTAQSKVQGEIVGIDWDPFLSGQDPAEHYWVRKVEHKGQTWLVSVWSKYGEQSHQPDVVAQVAKSEGRYGWCFTNFLYGTKKGDDLLTSLRALKKDREKA